jgi:hypothetical protein
MKRLLAAATAAAALAVAAPASADPPRYADRYERSHDRSAYDSRYGHDRYERRFTPDDLYRLQTRIDWAARSGQLTRREARWLSYQVDDLRARARHYWRTDGRISWREQQDLEARYEWLRREVRRQIFDGDYRAPAYDRW